jgi:S-adenosylmethionine synthetase
MTVEKVSPAHPDKIADRIAGALVDECYRRQDNPKCAFEVLVGHNDCVIMGESSVELDDSIYSKIIDRIVGIYMNLHINVTDQNILLKNNQNGKIRCGDNGVFEAIPETYEYRDATDLAKALYDYNSYDGKLIYDEAQSKATICWSNTRDEEIRAIVLKTIRIAGERLKINPLGSWTGGIDVDTGATNRKLGSDQPLTQPNGLHGKDLSKSDVSVTIVANILANNYKQNISCDVSIGDENVTFVVEKDGESQIKIKRTYEEVVAMAKEYIDNLGGFEKFAEWGIV